MSSVTWTEMAGWTAATPGISAMRAASELGARLSTREDFRKAIGLVILLAGGFQGIDQAARQ